MTAAPAHCGSGRDGENVGQGKSTYNVRYGSRWPIVVSRGDGTERDGGRPVGMLCRIADGTQAVGHRPSGGGSMRTFDVVLDARTPIARVTTEQPHGVLGSARPAVYRVDDPYGAPLGRVTYRRGGFFRMRRARWTAESMTGLSVRGYRGRLLWWALWWPVGLPLSLIVTVLSILGEGDGGFGSPSRVIWRDASGRAHLVFRGMADEYRVLDERWDPRLVAALLGLHQSYDPSEGGGAEGWYAS
ncbi:hypothetical protein Q5762_12190 [Streptomyces sp. P9(2023)]|uniref:hypothetical protein n=1 Tax=Streptomyces sp. P9(2023) TaxID=3064394 RepID=UPI0028F42B32|nr:hypothetical protein [Streptomyces sp. P9(2023)]MDT9689087.1 hypothetical protein [Streptomyces sp. P9(2023)]